MYKGFNKQMVLQYQCIDEPALAAFTTCPTSVQYPPICPPLANPTTQTQQIWCEPSTMLIECPFPNQIISILCAFYGKDPNYQCPGAFYSPSEPSYCYSQSSVQKIKAQCTGKRTCQLSGDPDFVFGSGFLNPCPGFAKILFIQWECLDKNAKSGAQEVQPTGQWNIGGPGRNKSIEICDYSRDEIEEECPWRTDVGSSPYVPKFLGNSTQTSFGYPIFQQIICNTGRIILLCPNDMVCLYLF